MFIALLFTCALAVDVSPVQKVIQLLDDLKGKVENDLSNEAAGMEKYAAWCGDENNSKEDAIRSTKRTISDLGATIEDEKATIMALTTDIDTLTGKISATEADLSKATSIRNGENKDFVAAEKELVDTIDTLERSKQVIKKNLGLMQTGAAKNMNLIASSLSKVVEASWVPMQQKQAIQDFLQAQSEAGDEDLSFQPQAKTSAYSSQSSGILDTLADMGEKAEDSLSGARKNEMQAAHAYAMLKQSLEDEITVNKKQLGQATLQRSQSEQALHEAEAGLAEAQSTLAADESYLAQLTQDCKTKSAQWAERQKNAAAETAAIEKAKDILAGGVKVFLQSEMKTKSHMKSKDDSTRAQVVALLSGFAKKYKGVGLVQIVMSAKSDPFGKIRGLIEGMVAKLTKEAAEEADAKSFCDEEISESRASQKDLNQKLDINSARIEKAESGKAKLLEEIQELEAQVAEIDQGQSDATQLRQEEHAEYLKASQDFKDSAEAVAKAIDVLSNYYNNAALIQTSQPDVDFSSAKSDVGSTIVSILEVAESDFSQLLAESESEESSAVAAFEKLSQENAVTKSTKQADAKGKKNEVKQLEVALGNYKENRATTSDEMDAVLAYLTKLKPTCETKVMSYGERKARREQEIAGLKEALTILSGEALIQVKSLRGIRRA